MYSFVIFNFYFTVFILGGESVFLTVGRSAETYQPSFRIELYRGFTGLLYFTPLSEQHTEIQSTLLLQ